MSAASLTITLALGLAPAPTLDAPAAGTATRPRPVAAASTVSHSGPTAAVGTGVVSDPRRVQDSPRVVDRIAAVVNGEVITLGQLERALRLESAPRILTGGPCRPEQEDSTPGGSGDDRLQRVLQELIDRLLVLQHVRRFPQPEITPQRVDEEMEALVACFGSPEAFREELERSGQTRASVRRDLEQQLMVVSYVQGRFGSIVEISDAEIRAYHEETLVPEMERRGEPAPALETVVPRIRQILEQQEINRRQEQWIADLRARAEITVYVW